MYIGLDLPNEYSGSKYTHSIKGTNAKAKANAAQGIPELIEIAVGKHFRENTEAKHWRNAKFGWYRYDSRFALPVYDEVGVQCERGRSIVRYDRECSKKQAGKSAGKIKRSADRLRHSDNPLEQTYKNTDIE